MQDAQEPEERAALDCRYQQAMADARTRGVEAKVAEFERAVGGSKAVATVRHHVLLRLVEQDSEIYPNWYANVAGGLRAPADDAWTAILRPRADAAVFPGYAQDIRFAALSLDGAGVESYGTTSGCVITFRESMIAHRANVFETNSVLWAQDHVTGHGTSVIVPAGYRAPWGERGRLAVAKLSSKIDRTTTTDSFPQIILHQASSAADEDFIEVHIWGPMTRRTFERVALRKATRRGRSQEQRLQQEKLERAGVQVEFI